MQLFLRQLIAPFVNQFYPYLSTCGRCRLNWNVVKSHITHFEPGHGCFPLCEFCWKSLTPSERLPYYKKLHDWWMITSPPDGIAELEGRWPLIEKAVLEGK